MTTDKKILRILGYVAAVLLMLGMSQVVTFLGSLVLPIDADLLVSKPWIFTALVGVFLALGVFLAGLQAIAIRWLPIERKALLRFIGALAGAYLPMLAALLIFGKIEPGSPIFLITLATSIMGFFLAGMLRKK